MEKLKEVKDNFKDILKFSELALKEVWDNDENRRFSACRKQFSVFEHKEDDIWQEYLKCKALDIY